jgi:heme-degrading monooxygenase HmoA
MARLMVQHRVANYDIWKQHYDGHRPSRDGAGLTNARVYRCVDDSDDVVVVADVADAEKVKTWAASSDLRSAMEKGGVLGQPSVLIGD